MAQPEVRQPNYDSLATFMQKNPKPDFVHFGEQRAVLDGGPVYTPVDCPSGLRAEANPR